MNLKNKKILVTGASSGIGRALVIEFAKQGSHLAVHYRSNKSGAEETLKECKKYYQENPILVQADLSDSAQAEKMFADLESAGFVPDVLISNGGEAKGGSFLDSDSWEFSYQNILLAQLHPIQSFFRQRGDSQRKIIIITSLYGNLTTGNPEFIAYSAMKAALNNLTATLAKQFKSKVLVNALAPGYTWTSPWEGIAENEKKRYESATLIERFVDPTEVAALAVTVAQNDAITGQIFTIDGGTSLRPMEEHG